MTASPILFALLLLASAQAIEHKATPLLSSKPFGPSWAPTGPVGGGLLDPTISARSVTAGFRDRACNDSRGLLENGNLPENYQDSLGATAFDPFAMTTGDVDGDGIEDILALTGARDTTLWIHSASLMLFRGVGDGSFRRPSSLPIVGRYAPYLSLLPQPDSKPPLVLLASSDMEGGPYALRLGALSVPICDSYQCLRYQLTKEVALPALPVSIVTGLFDADKSVDIAVALQGKKGQVLVLLSAGHGFDYPEASRRLLVTQASIYHGIIFPSNDLQNSARMAVGPYNGAGGANADPDLLVVTFDENSTSLFTASRVELFEDFAKAAHPVSKKLDWIQTENDEFTHLIFADFNGDGLVDAADYTFNPGGTHYLAKTSAVQSDGFTDIDIHLAKAGGGYRNAPASFLGGNGAFAITPLQPIHGRPLFALSYNLDPWRGETYGGISIIEADKEGVVEELGTLRGGPMTRMQLRLVAMNGGATLAYADAGYDAYLPGGVGTLSVAKLFPLFEAALSTAPAAPAAPGAAAPSGAKSAWNLFPSPLFPAEGGISDALGRRARPTLRRLSP
jgi:hypothetical protein